MIKKTVRITYKGTKRSYVPLREIRDGCGRPFEDISKP